ncbi:MAG: hypothetical protein EBR26_04240, partial [Microbacteriaceae bacterium]|nr:hypothetical protein [Microbacteriaceae bacterium]
MRRLAGLALAISLSVFSGGWFSSNASAGEATYGSSIVSAGQAFTCDITLSGDARCWGASAANQTKIPEDLGKIAQISSGGFHVCALTLAGDVRCWGSNNQGQSSVPADLGKVIQVSAGFEHTCAVTLSGTVRCWGSNSDGQRTVPSYLGKVAQVSAGLYHTCTVSVIGVGECWGNFRDGQTNVPFDIGKISQISAGWYHTCAITVSSQLRCWGWNQDGQITVPTSVTSWSQVSAGFGNTCAVSSSGDAYCWGSDSEPHSKVPSDLGKVSQISTGSSHTCALTTLAIVRCWGSNNFGQLMVPLTVTPRPSIVGNAIVGGSVSADTGTWDDGVSFSYQWLRDGAVIQDSNSASYVPKDSDFEAQLTVRVTGSKTGYSSVTVVSPPVEVGPGILSKTSKPLMAGTRFLGGGLTADPGLWDAGVSFTYQWLRDGIPIAGANQVSYHFSVIDLDKNISLKLTGSKNGYSSAFKVSDDTRISNVSIEGTPCFSLSDQKIIPIDTSTWRNTTGQPKITGPINFGKTAQASTGVWANASKLCTFWLSGEQIVPKVTATSYKVASADIGKELRLMVIAVSKTGELSARYSDPVVVSKANFAKPKTPVIKGTAKVGTKLTGSVASWESGTSYTYQWLKDLNPIGSQNSTSYTPAVGDVGSSLILKVCATKQFYADTCLVSAPQTVALGTISPAGKAAVSGSSLKVGATLTGTTSKWMSGVTLKYQWLLNGSPISGAIGSQRVIQQSD